MLYCASHYETTPAEFTWRERQHVQAEVAGLTRGERRGGTPKQNDQYEPRKCHVSYLKINLSNG